MLAVEYIHSLGYTHRDIKPENFVVSKDLRVKMIDFGLCSRDARMTKKVGSPLYIAPDVLSGSYDKQCDMWSAGCLLYILLCGYPPFGGDKPITIVRNVLKGTYKFDPRHWYHISESAKDLVKKIMAPREDRITAKEALAHAWFKPKSSTPDIS